MESSPTSQRWFTTVDQRQRDDKQRLRHLWQMRPAQRVVAMYRGELTLTEGFAWAVRYPGQVPLVNGEYWFIAIKSPEVCE